MERKNLWAPWRMKYIQDLTQKHPCFLCYNLEHPELDEKTFVLWRTKYSIVTMNKFPYNNGHLLIAPNRHIADLDEASSEESLDIINLIRDCKKVISNAIKPHGFNVGINFGRCAGAGLPDHMHVHIVPRWNGDTNYMHVCSDTDVISQSMTELYDLLLETAKNINILQSNTDKDV